MSALRLIAAISLTQVLSLTYYVNPAASTSPIPDDPAHPFPSIGQVLALAMSQGSADISLQPTATPISFPATPLPIPVQLNLNGCVLSLQGAVQVLAALVIRDGTVTGAVTQPSILQVPLTPYGQGSLTVSNVTVTGLKCVFIGVAGGAVTLLSSVFKGNTETILAVADIGGVVSIQDCTFSQSAASSGVIIGLTPSMSISISRCVFSEIQIGEGGVVLFLPSSQSPASSLSISDSAFAGITAAAIVTSTTSTITRCSFTAVVQGIYSSPTPNLLLTDCTFTSVGMAIIAESVTTLNIVHSGVTGSMVSVLATSSNGIVTISSCHFWQNANTLDYSPGVTLQGFKNVTIHDTRIEANSSPSPPNLYLIQCPGVLLSSLFIGYTESQSAAAFSLISSNAVLFFCHLYELKSVSPISLGYAAQIDFVYSVLENMDGLDTNIVTGEVNTLSGNSTIFRNLTCAKELFQVHSFLSAISFTNCTFEDVMAKTILDEEPVEVLFTGCVLNFTSRSSAMVMIYTTISDFFLVNSVVTGSLGLVLDVYSTGFVTAFFTNVTFMDLSLDGLVMSISTRIRIENCSFRNVTIANFHRYFLLLS